MCELKKTLLSLTRYIGKLIDESLTTTANQSAGHRQRENKLTVFIVLHNHFISSPL